MGKISGLAKIVLASFLLFVPLEKVFGQESQGIKDKTVLVVNPGHGGEELGYDGRPIKESSLNLDVSKLIMEKLNCNYSVFLTREVDSCVNRDSVNYDLNKKINLTDELLSRIDFAKKKNSDYFLNVHFNANRDTSRTGMQIFYPAIYSKRRINNNRTDFCVNASDCWSYSKKTYEFAEDLGNFFRLNGFDVEVCGADYRILIGKQSRSSKKINYPVNNNLLLEFAYISNDKEYEYIISEEGKERYASIIAEYFNSLRPEKLEPKEIRFNYGK